MLGRFWAQATPEQRGRFATAFQHLLMRQYARALLNLPNDGFEWLPVSLATNYRGMFVHDIRAYGLDAVIERLEKKISS